MTVRLILISALLAAAQAVSLGAWGQNPEAVKIGVLVDLNGPFADLSGPGAVEAARLAISDFGGKVLGRPIELLTGDHQNKTDISVAKAREWYDSGVDLILEGGTSSGALALAAISTEKKKFYIPSTPSISKLTNENCGPYVIHYTYDTYALSNVAARAIIQQGKKNWFFITLDFAFGHQIEAETTALLKQYGGKSVGSVSHPLSANDFSSYIIQAARSNADIVALANAGPDTQKAIKQAREFGALDKQEYVALAVFLTDIHALGLKDAQGMLLATAWYWDLNDETRAFSKRFFEKLSKMPTMTQAGVYSAVLTYLKSVQAANSTDTDKVRDQMRKMKFSDMFAKNGYVRDDGLYVHDMYLARVKTPAESKRPWDYYSIEAVVSGEDAFQPLSESRCPLIKK